MRGKVYGVSIAVVAVAISGVFSIAYADSYSSTSYKIDATISSSGGTLSSSSYSLTSSTGENAIGNGASGSYKVGMGFVTQLDKSLQLTVQPSGLVAAYRLDEPSGTTVADDSTYNATGTMIGTLTSVSGKLATGLSFDGSSQTVHIANNTQTQLTTAGTVEAWVKSSTTTGSMGAVVKASNFWLGLGGGKATAYEWSGGTTTSDTTVIADGTWHHIAMTLASGANASTLYTDGVAKKTFTWTPLSQTGTVTIGSVYNGASYLQYFTGSIDHVKIFNRTFTPSEIAAEYNAGIASVPTGVSLGTITAGASNAALVDVITQTDAGGYTLAVNQDHDLNDGTNSISPVSGSIAAPVAWSEGSTKGLGFSLTATNATAIPGLWNSGNSYAAFPASATTFYSRTGLQSSNDYLTMRFRADVPGTQVTSGAAYSNTITITGTMAP